MAKDAIPRRLVQGGGRSKGEMFVTGQWAAFANLAPLDSEKVQARRHEATKGHTKDQFFTVTSRPARRASVCSLRGFVPSWRNFALTPAALLTFGRLGYDPSPSPLA
jgi:hypothetical protein